MADRITILNAVEVMKCTSAIAEALPDGDFERIMIKPNWVIHETHPSFPIRALVTDSRLIDRVIMACLEKYRYLKRITIGDVPLQSCDFELLARQSGLDTVREKYSRDEKPIVRFCDLRKERWRLNKGFMELVNDLPGDPVGYSLVGLDHDSMLEEISHNAARFRVADYDPQETISAHRSGNHKYLIAGSVLDADLVINMPKMKTHQKAGITGALKNLVGINGSKAYLVHHQLGKPSKGGDEFPENADPWIVLQTRLRSVVQKRSGILFYPLKWGWEIVKKVRGISTMGTRENLAGSFYVGSGSWYGNDSIWRMVYDLNQIVLFAMNGTPNLQRQPQRKYFCILDALTAGEGNGPLQPLPVALNALVLGENPFLVDAVMATMMGLDHEKIPLLRFRHRFKHDGWRNTDMYRFQVRIDSSVAYEGLRNVPTMRQFLPPPGWIGHIELNERGG